MKKQFPNRPANMSQLDYLWTTYGAYVISNSLDVEDSIPTSEAVKKAIETQVSGIVELDTEEVDNKVKIIGRGSSGEELSSILIDKDTKIVSFTRHTITQEDIDNGFGNALDEEWLVLETSNGSKFSVPLEDFVAKGQTTNTIITKVVDGKIASELKISNPIIDKSVDLKTSDSGVYADLVIDSDSESNIKILKGDKGVLCNFYWEGTDFPVRLKSLNTYDEYLLETVSPNTIYFIKDIRAIYLNGVKYATSGEGGGLDPTLYYTKDETNELIDDVKQDLSNKVSWTGKNIVLPNSGALIGTPLVFNSTERPVVQTGEDSEQVAYMSDLSAYTWNDVVATKAMRIADLPEKYPVGILTIKNPGGKDMQYDGSENIILDINHIYNQILKLKEDIEYQLSTKQNNLVSGVNVKRINGKSILGNGDILISSDSSALRYKGSRPTFSSLPANPNIGDIYNIVNDGVNYAWNGEEWEQYGTPTASRVDLYKDVNGEITSGEIEFSDGTILPINIFIK